MPVSGSVNYMLLFSIVYLNKIHKTTYILNKCSKQITFYINTNSESTLFYCIFLPTNRIKIKSEKEHYHGLYTCYVGKVLALNDFNQIKILPIIMGS